MEDNYFFILFLLLMEDNDLRVTTKDQKFLSCLIVNDLTVEMFGKKLQIKKKKSVNCID